MDKLEFLKRSLIAHRGLHDEESGIIENTIDSFRGALEKGYIIELDVHITKDKQVIVFHDDDLKRMCGINKKIKSLEYKELKTYKLDNNESFIPKFEDVLNLVNGQVPILIEIKYDSKIGVLEKEITKLLDKYNGEYAIQSFNPFSLLWFKFHKRDIVRGQLVSKYTNTKMNFIKKFLLKNMFFNFLTTPHFISYDVHNTNFQEIINMKKKKLVLGWTVSNVTDFDKYYKHYDNLICEKFI